jgi:hypothetical protein
MSELLSREELINEEFDRLFYRKHGQRICRDCWRLVETEVNLPQSRKEQDERKYENHPEEFGTKGSALAGTRDLFEDNTERGHGTRWCECGSRVRDYSADRINDIAVENFDPETNRSNWLLSYIADGNEVESDEVDAADYNNLETHADRQEYANALATAGVDFDAYEESGEYVNHRALNIANDIGRNFCRTAALLRWSSPSSEIPEFSTGTFIGSFLNILESGETTKIKTALRYAFADAVVSFRTAKGTDDLNLLEESRWVASRPPIPDRRATDSANSAASDSEESDDFDGAAYRGAWT